MAAAVVCCSGVCSGRAHADGVPCSANVPRGCAPPPLFRCARHPIGVSVVCSRMTYVPGLYFSLPSRGRAGVGARLRSLSHGLECGSRSGRAHADGVPCSANVPRGFAPPPLFRCARHPIGVGVVCSRMAHVPGLYFSLPSRGRAGVGARLRSLSHGFECGSRSGRAHADGVPCSANVRRGFAPPPLFRCARHPIGVSEFRAAVDRRAHRACPVHRASGTPRSEIKEERSGGHSRRGVPGGLCTRPESPRTKQTQEPKQ